MAEIKRFALLVLYFLSFLCFLFGDIGCGGAT